MDHLGSQKLEVGLQLQNVVQCCAGRFAVARAGGDVPAGLPGGLLAVPAVVGGNPGTQAETRLPAAGQLPPVQVAAAGQALRPAVDVPAGPGRQDVPRLHPLLHHRHRRPRPAGLVTIVRSLTFQMVSTSSYVLTFVVLAELKSHS